MYGEHLCHTYSHYWADSIIIVSHKEILTRIYLQTHYQKTNQVPSQNLVALGLQSYTAYTPYDVYFFFALCIKGFATDRQLYCFKTQSSMSQLANTCIMGLDSFRMGYHIYSFSKSTPDHESPDIQKKDQKSMLLWVSILWTIVYTMAVGVSVVIQAVLCIQTATGRNTCIKSCWNRHCKFCAKWRLM